MFGDVTRCGHFFEAAPCLISERSMKLAFTMNFNSFDGLSEFRREISIKYSDKQHSRKELIVMPKLHIEEMNGSAILNDGEPVLLCCMQSAPALDAPRISFTRRLANWLFLTGNGDEDAKFIAVVLKAQILDENGKPLYSN